MNNIWTGSVLRQFHAAITMLENAIRSCPDDTWLEQCWPGEKDLPDLSAYWYVAYHCLFWLDLYLSGAMEGFTPPPPFNLDELDPAGLTPEQPYSQDVLLAYLEHNREKCRTILTALTDEQAQRMCRFGWGSAPYAELLLDNMRHVQEHAAQLNLVLGQKGSPSKGWAATSAIN